MSSVFSNTKRSQSPQFSSTPEAQITTKGEDQAANPLRMKLAKTAVPPVKRVEVHVAATNIKGVIAPVKATVPVYKTLGLWQESRDNTPIPFGNTPVMASLPVTIGSTKGDHNKPRARDVKVVNRKLTRRQSRSSSSEHCSPRKSSPVKDVCETPSKCSPKSITPPVKKQHQKKCSPPPIKKYSPLKEKKCPPEKCAPPLKTCTECNPVGNMCTPITIADIYRLYKNESTNDFTRHVARSILAGLKCPPSTVGCEFWPDFDYTPTVFAQKPSETCHCGDKRRDCKCIVSDLTVCKDAVSLDTFNFHYPYIESKEGEVTLYPFGSSCVPSPLRICEDARFTIYAVKRCLNRNFCCDKCKDPNLCSHGVSKGGEDDEINYNYIIQWAYDALKCGETLNDGVRELICCTLRSMKGRESCLSETMFDKYSFVHKELTRNSKDYENAPIRGREVQRQTRSLPQECSRNVSPSTQQAVRPPIRKPDSECERPSIKSRPPIRRPESECEKPRQQDYVRNASPSCSREVKRELSASPSCSSPEASCEECGYTQDNCRCCSKCHLLKCKCHPLQQRKVAQDKQCSKCKQSEKKCTCVFPVVPESPFAVFHVTGKWICDVVNCDSACVEGTKGTRYKIVLDESNLKHVDGGLVCEGWSWFNPSRYTSYFFKMCPQRLDFFPCPPVKEGCGC
jgi:hypothetical protein